MCYNNLLEQTTNITMFLQRTDSVNPKKTNHKLPTITGTNVNNVISMSVLTLLPVHWKPAISRTLRFKLGYFYRNK